MSRVKSPLKKARLGKALKQNRRVPLFVVARTKRNVTQNRAQRNWRRRKLRIHGD